MSQNECSPSRWCVRAQVELPKSALVTGDWKIAKNWSQRDAVLVAPDLFSFPVGGLFSSKLMSSIPEYSGKDIPSTCSVEE
eukprot:9416706-Alexandrium_andersonii.AAC.1